MLSLEIELEGFEQLRHPWVRLTENRRRYFSGKYAPAFLFAFERVAIDARHEEGIRIHAGGDFAAGLILGLSPGFRIPPPRTVPDAEKVEEEDPREGDALIRTIFQALLYELSFVTVPAYKETEVEARSWSLTNGGVILPDAPDTGLHRILNRWRA